MLTYNWNSLKFSYFLFKYENIFYSWIVWFVKMIFISSSLKKKQNLKEIYLNLKFFSTILTTNSDHFCSKATFLLF